MIVRKIAYVVAGVLALMGTSRAQAFSFSWSLSQDGPVSAGIYDEQGRIVRTLWAIEGLSAGTYQSMWDGLKDDGTASSPGTYAWKVVGNHSTYSNIGTIGNTGMPQVSFGHVPFFIEGIATDAQKNIYTVHDWNEAGHDINRWAPGTGIATYNSGHILTDFLPKAIAVEPDASYAYITAYGGGTATPGDRAHIQFAVFRIDLRQSRLENLTDAGGSIKVYDGNADYPPGASAADIELMRVPLISIALRGDNLYVTDALGSRILVYDKTTGALQREIKNVPVACGIALGSDGRIWVGNSHTKVSVYSPTGTLLATPITNLSEVRALSMQGSTLCVADRKGCLLKYAVNGLRVSQSGSFGQTAKPGETAPTSLSNINGMAMDVAGNIIVSDRMGAGARLQKFDAKNKPLWQQMGLEFSGQAAYGKDNPDLLISSYRNVYKLQRSTGQWTFFGPGGTDTRGRYFGNYENAPFGVLHVVRFKNKDFLYYPAGDSLAIYAIGGASGGRGPALTLSAVLGGSRPGPDGVDRPELWLDENRYLWSWVDDRGDGAISYTSVTNPGEVKLDGVPGSPADWKWDRTSMCVDDSGWVWMPSAARLSPQVPFERNSIYVIPPQGLNSKGIPIYRWANAVKVMDEQTGRDALGQTDGTFNWMMVNRSPDGMVYALAASSMESLPQNGARWMGGNVLFAFDGGTAAAPAPLSAPKWQITLPEKSVGMSPIPGGPGGVMVGIHPQKRGTIGHYSRDGLLIGSFGVSPEFGDDVLPNLASGALDAFLSVNCNRDPRDGILDVFAEDNWNQRIIWYRVDDRQMETHSGTSALIDAAGRSARYTLTVNQGIGDGNYAEGTVVPIAAQTPPPGKVFVAWEGDIAGLADVHASQTTFTMTAGEASLTPTYAWETGSDTIRFCPAPEGQHRLKDTLFEGTSADPVVGPYTPIYQIPDDSATGWSEVSVNLKDYRYLRWRDPVSNGMIGEIEFYRNGKKLSGTGFGTEGSWGNHPDETYEKALDGDISTFFNGPEGKHAYVGIDTLKVSANARTLTVEFGSGGGRYDPGTNIVIAAAIPPKGKTFKKWSGDTAIVSNPFLARTSVTMPSQNVKLKALYDN